MQQYKDLLSRIATKNRNLQHMINKSTRESSFDNAELTTKVVTYICKFGANCQVLAWCDPKDNFVKYYDFIMPEEQDAFLKDKNTDDIYKITLSELNAVLSLQGGLLHDLYAIVPKDDIFKELKNRSKAGKATWAKLSPEERSRIARERGRAGAAKRWRKTN